MDRRLESSSKGEEYLQHYGIPGMKWGVRRTRKALAKARTEARVKAVNKEGRTAYKSSGRKLTEAELNKRIQRMELEKKYNQLNSRTVKEGEAMARRIVSGIGEKTVKTIGTGLLFYAGKKVVEKKFGKEVAAAIPSLKK
jgi:hypothetical protein